METTLLLKKWADDMAKALVAFKEAVEALWEVLESYGVTVEKLEAVSAQIDAGVLTKFEGWQILGLPRADYPGD